MSDTSINDQLLPVDNPDDAPAAWFDPELGDTQRDFSPDERELARLLRPGADLEPEPDPTDPGPGDPDAPAPDDGVDEVDAPPVETPPAPETPPEPEPPAPTPPTAPAEPEFIDIGGRLYPRERAAEILQLIDMGIAQVTNTPLVPPAPAVPETPTGPDVPAFDPNDFADTELARATQAQLQAIRDSQTPVEEKLARVEQILIRQEQAAEAARLESMRAAETEAVASVKDSFALSDEDMAKLYALTERSGIVNGMASANPALMSDMKQLAENALTATYWSTEEFRQRDIQREIDAKVADITQTRETSERKSRAGSLAGGGGAVTRATAPKTAGGQPRDPIAAALEAVQEEVV